MTRRGAAAGVALLAALLSAERGESQDVDRQIRDNTQRLDEIRRERNQLEEELTRLRGRA
ncbi:MAG: hypothetical protein HY337_00595, partial [Gemmatimonadetes bacterium]|nr:hypothetical protein [Gemmatimonadota bacterium]